MKSLVQTVHEYATGRAIIILLILALSVYFYMILFSIPGVTGQATDLEIFDLRPGGYSVAYARELLSAIGEEGRAAYLYRQIPIDLIYPGLFAITNTLLLVWLFRRAFGLQSKMNVSLVVPFAAGLFDYAENVGIIVMLTSFPRLSENVVMITSLFTILKSIFTTAFFGLALVAVILWAKNRFRPASS